MYKLFRNHLRKLIIFLDRYIIIYYIIDEYQYIKIIKYFKLIYSKRYRPSV